MVSTRGGIIEWAASDGRKGKLTGAGMQRLAEASLAQVPSAKSAKDASSNRKTATEQAVSEIGGGIMDLFAENDNDKKSGKNTQDTGADTSGWLPLQDKTLMKLKSENASLSWEAIAEEVGKSAEQCKGRFKAIKPKDWKPNAAKKADCASGQEGRSNRTNGGPKGGKRNGKKNEGHGNDPGNTWGGNAASNWGTGNGNAGGNNAWDTGNGNTGNNNAWDTDKNAAAATWDNINNAGSQFGTSGGGGNAWGGNDTFGNNPGAHTGGTAGAWGATTGQDNNPCGGANAWDNPVPAKTASKAPSKAPTVKAASQPQHTSRNKTTRDINDDPLDLELKPDDKFSADDLRLVARILKQDCSLLWQRVSWRFQDKTGRTLHPDVFERKVTGRVEDKGSRQGGRKKK